MAHPITLTALKCVVTGDGAVGKVWLPTNLATLPPLETQTDLIEDMPPHILHNQCISGRVHTYRVSQASAMFTDLRTNIAF